MTRRHLIKVMAACVLWGIVAIATLAVFRGRDSRAYHLLSAAFSPATERLVRTDDTSALQKPFRASLRAPMGEGWKWFQRDLVEVIDSERALTLAPVRENVWWKNQRGPMIYRTLSGDASVIVSVSTHKRSDPTKPPDREWQFAGVILRDPRSDALLGRESYVFNVVGYRGVELSVETKSTVSGTSRVDAWRWNTGGAELRIDRKGSRFLLFARPLGGGRWRHLITYDRPDLPGRMQLGLIIYAHSEGRGIHDLQASFDGLIVQ